MWNKITALMVLVTTASLLLTPMEIEARGGRGGGGGGRGGGGARGGGGGAYRGGNTMNRTPTMSRASSQPRQQVQSRPATQQRQQVQSRPATQQPRQQVQSRPATQQPRQQIQNRPAAAQRPANSHGRGQQARQTQRPSAANRADVRDQVNRYSQNRPAQSIDRQALSQRSQNFSSNRGNQINQNRQLSDRASQRLHQTRPNSNQWFNRDFMDRHDLDLGYAGRGDLWKPAAWATLASWGAWNWSTPYYYDEGGYTYPLSTTDSSYTYPESTSTTPYQPVQTEPIQTQPIQTQPMQSDQTTASTSEDWLPLGVFAVTSNANIITQSDRYMQLAINRNGEIAGILYNSVTDTAQDLTGMVDPTSQKAYWSMANRTDSPIASTGIYNLTEDQTPINVHFADGSDQTWTLVRLKQEQ